MSGSLVPMGSRALRQAIVSSLGPIPRQAQLALDASLGGTRYPRGPTQAWHPHRSEFLIPSGVGTLPSPSHPRTPTDAAMFFPN